MLCTTLSNTLMPPDPIPTWFSDADRNAPNLRIAQALATFNPTLAYKVLTCWRPPFRQPCKQPRFCQSCARYRQRRLTQGYERHLSTMVMPWWLTLTAPCGRNLTRWHLRRFRRRLTSLRRWRRFHRSVRGGVYTIEVKLGDSGLWNVHVHILLDLADLTLTEPAIKKAWHRRTGAFKIDFEPVEAGVLAMVFAYATKPQELPKSLAAGAAIDALTRPSDVLLDPDRLRELWEATRRFRPTQAFGSFSHRYGKPPPNRRGGNFPIPARGRR